MYKDSRIVVVVPARNEAAHISRVITSMPALVDGIVVVDDCSDDGTADQAREAGDSRVAIVATSAQSGVGGAMVLGYRRAIELGCDIAVKMDGDGQMPAEYLPSLLDAIIEDGYDYAKGNRFLTGESVKVMPTHRMLGNIVLTFMTKMASGYWHVFDPQNGYTAIKSKVLQTIDLDKLKRDYFFENDMLIQLNFQRCRVKDVAIPARYGEEESEINVLKVGATFPLRLLRKFFDRIIQKYVLRDFSPIALFLFRGLILFVWGAGLGLYLWARTIITGLPTATGTIMLSLLPLILGFQLILQAIVLDIQESPK
jgi:glycosyltransferase involved in cell wall biosynthesis